MGMKVHFVFFVLFAVGLSFGQPPTPVGAPEPFAVLRQFLNLTNDQYTKLAQIQTDFGRLVESKRDRVGQVNFEINQETAKSSLDASALGVRYLELEVICREVVGASAALSKSSLAVLTDVQKVKLKQLEDAMNLGRAIAEAQSFSLLSNSGSTVIVGTGGFASFLLGPAYLGLPGCRFTGSVGITPFIAIP